MIRAMLVAAILVATIGNGSAWFGMFEINNETFFYNDWNVADDEGKPVKTIKKSDGKRIHAWIDITGFRNESEINGTRYVNGHAKDYAIVKRGAKHKLKSGEQLISFDSTLAVTGGINTTTAVQKSTLKYETWVCLYDDVWEWIAQTPVKLNVSYTADSPETFNNALTNFSVTITSYNNSVTPYTLIRIPPRWNIIKETVEYKNNTTHYQNKTGWVTTNSRGAEHIRFLNNTLHVEDPTYTVSRRAEFYVINEAPLNWSLLNISVFTPYVEITNTPCHIAVVHSDPSRGVHWKILLVLTSFIALCIIVSYKVVTGWRK